MTFQDPMEMSVTDLAFDLQNPRLAESTLSEKSIDSDVIAILWDTMDVRELVLSIAASGFFRHEPLIVAREGGKNVVIEGNRRLAAVKVLLNPTLIEAPGPPIPSINIDAKESLRSLPVIFGTREGAWQYIGFKHVNGPAKWSSYAKAVYIAKVHREYGVALQDIASQIGDTHKTAQRLYRGIEVIEQAEQMGAFDRDESTRRHFAFSHLYTGLQLTGIREFIGLPPESDEDVELVPQDRKEELRELCVWLYGSKKDGAPAVIRSQNPDLRRLNAVVANPEAVAALRVNGNLSAAFEISRPASNVFKESLYNAKRELEKAHGLQSTGYDGSAALLSVAGDVAELAYDLFDVMQRKHSPRRVRRIESN